MKYILLLFFFFITSFVLAIEDNTSLFKEVEGRSIEDEDGMFESMQHVTEDEEYFDGDSSINEINHFREEDEEEEEEEDGGDDEEEEEYNVFQNADTSEYFDNFPRQQEQLNTEENTIIDQHNDEQPAEYVADLPLKETMSINIPWQRAEPKRVPASSNEFYQDMPITPNTTQKKEMNLMPVYAFVLLCLMVIVLKKTTKSHTDSAWHCKEEKEYSLPLHNRHFKSEMKSC
ncbi:hypothetical protein CU098_006563 [Rhizopus stolonifer]|uniref:Uncharacterized protein n=1 Tax=Rhizopus stolonifer TaxID=4846 RepID=A0A367J7C5_RHIST|nr:hypothetical protein CU098_006563 [Rhizopus stolonifer]